MTNEAGVGATVGAAAPRAPPAANASAGRIFGYVASSASLGRVAPKTSSFTSVGRGASLHALASATSITSAPRRVRRSSIRFRTTMTLLLVRWWLGDRSHG